MLDNTSNIPLSLKNVEKNLNTSELVSQLTTENIKKFTAFLLMSANLTSFQIPSYTKWMP